MATNQQQAASAPEDDWIPFIRSMYPDHLTRTYFFPPLFFNRVPHTVENFAGLTVHVRVNPLQSLFRKLRRPFRHNPPPQPPPPPSGLPPPPPSTAGTVFTENPADLQDERFQDSDLHDDDAQRRCLQALQKIGEGMMVISQLKFRQYLDNQHNPQQHINPTNIISQLPSITHPSIPHNIVDGECDIIIISRQYGILVCEIKSVGGQYLSTQSPADQDQIIARVVTKAIKQLDNQEIALKHLVHDMAGGNIRMTKALLLPNINSAQLTAAVNSSQQLQAHFLQTLCGSTCGQNVAQAVGLCLCSGQLHRPKEWWKALWTAGHDPSMTKITYTRLVARSCGPASTVDIPTACQPRKVVRTFGEAVVETALRFSLLVLTPRQVSLLNMQPEPQYVYLQGPPGTGKTMVLVLKALQWARQGGKVVVVSQYFNRAVTILVEEQLSRMLGTATAAAAAAAAAAPAENIDRHTCDLGDIKKNVSDLAQLLGAGPDPEAFILFDEAPDDKNRFFQWLAEVRQRLPSARVWAASLYRVDNNPTCPPPPWLEIYPVTEPLRSPPAVIRRVERRSPINGHNIPLYSAPALPPPTEGPPVQKVHHKWGAGHTEGQPWQCAQCADTIGLLLTRELHVGQPGAPQFKDTWILCDDLPDTRDADVLVSGLSLHGVPVRVMPRRPSDDDAQDLALALIDQVIVTDIYNVQGMERAVVIAMGGWNDDYLSYSRSTSFLCYIKY